MNDQELKEKIANIIWDINLNLSGRVVITEAANGPYCVTPLMAAMAGARVFALAQPSAYGSVDDIFDYLQPKVEFFGLNSIFFLEELSSDILKQADIITNSGHLRPLNEKKLKHLKSGCVIPLMYEKWELREEDIDLGYCHQHKIKVAGTNERHSGIGVFDYLGEMAIELIKRAELTVDGQKYVLVCNNEFGPYIAKTLLEYGVSLGVVDLLEHREQYDQRIDWLGTFPSIEVDENYADAAGIIFTAYPFDQPWIGAGLAIDPQRLKECFKTAKILRFAGDINEVDLNQHDIPFYPVSVRKGHMGILPSDIGWDPIIRLQAGGLRVAQAMLDNNFQVKNQVIGELITDE